MTRRGEFQYSIYLVSLAFYCAHAPLHRRGEGRYDEDNQSHIELPRPSRRAFRFEKPVYLFRDSIISMATMNTLFAIFAVSQPEALKQKLDASQNSFPFLSKSVSGESWLVIAPNAITTKEFSDALGITDGSTSSAVVVRVENYYGRANTDLWEWIAAKIGVPLGSES